ncbi:hypothetical protein [Siphonobacter sp. SORGH_AS_0500]|uniref:hypothetical protein n=1 Tax=Siphonobacter sp. SORGH_AS_0500 TaxID=1864824 RepID=UPI0028553DC3|nr:hypothetical protein [Siphonobacter sp. SORGH_AS_0500]MDR6194759.1 hypothetical protein [Siphonobacter sp. SORGH_AS_0500]
MLLDKIKVVFGLIQWSSDECDDVNNTLILKTTVPDYADKLNSIGIEFEEISNTEFHIDSSSIPNTLIFLNKERCVEKNKKFIDLNNQTITKNIVILLWDGTFYYYDMNSKKSYNNKGPIASIYFLNNIIAYKAFEDYLKSNKFCDYYNSAYNEIVIYSTLKGILKIKYPSSVAPLNNNINYMPEVNNLITKCSNEDFKNHFKNILFSNGTNNIISQVNSIFDKLDSLIQQADNNYQLQLKNFSFDKLKSDLDKEKDKYFVSIREIVNKMSAQFIAIPISIGATLFSSYKIESKQTIIYIIIAFSLYWIYCSVVQTYNYHDLLLVKKDFKIDFETIKNKSGLKLSEIVPKSKIVNRKIFFTQIFYWSFMIILAGLAVTFLYFMFEQIDKIGLPKPVIQNPKLASY